LPENQGGLFPLGTGLFSANPQVRRLAVDLLDRIAQAKVRRSLARPHPDGSGLLTPAVQWGRRGAVAQAGAAFIANLNPYMQIAYDDLRQTV